MVSGNIHVCVLYQLHICSTIRILQLSILSPCISHHRIRLKGLLARSNHKRFSGWNVHCKYFNHWNARANHPIFKCLCYYDPFFLTTLIFHVYCVIWIVYTHNRLLYRITNELGFSRIKSNLKWPKQLQISYKTVACIYLYVVAKAFLLVAMVIMVTYKSHHEGWTSMLILVCWLLR